MLHRPRAQIVLLLLAPLLAAGCGSSSHPRSTSSAGAAGSPAALSAEAKSKATGDIPDNQVFLTFHDRAAGYSMKYPEGWTQRGGGKDVTFQDKNNVVHIVVSAGSAPTPASVNAELAALARTTPSLKSAAARPVRLGGASAIKATYTTRSAPDPVTGRRVSLTVDRYELGHGGRRAVVDLGTPVGVDNVDAYRMMISSFQWR